MPAGLPPRGLDRRFLVGDRILRNTGADFTVNYQSAGLNAATGVILVAGDNDYVGLMTNGLYGELVQGANIPALPGTSTIVAVHNDSGGGWIVMDGSNNIFSNAAEDLSVPWVDITPVAVPPRSDLLEYNGAILTFTARIAGPPVRDMEFSIDNGATFNSDPGDFTGINTNLSRAVTNPAQNRILVCSSGGTSIAHTQDSGNPPYTWSLLPIATAGIPQTDAAVSDSGREGVVVSTQGQIWTTSDFSPGNSGMIPNADNPFVSSALGTAPTSVRFCAALQGFVIVANSGPTCAFIPTADMTQVIPGNYLGNPVTAVATAGVSDGEQIIWPGSNNEAMITLRNIGQLSRG